MNIKITGSSGYLGNIISEELKNKGHSPEGIKRKLLYGKQDKLSEIIKNTDVIINLAGAPILQRWTEKNKKTIYESRVKTTQNLALAIKYLPEKQRPKTVVSVSGISIYANWKTHTEESNDFNTGFLSEIVQDWESAWSDLSGNIRLVLFRLAPVLGKNSDTIKNLKLPFKLGLGGKVASGRQPFPFVHEHDVARAFAWAVENKGANGIYNVAAPQQITNSQFSKALAKTLHRPAIIPIPAFGLRILYGKAAAMITEGPAILPQALQNEGFDFRYPTIEAALQQIFE
jgi:uncharacterized protein